MDKKAEKVGGNTQKITKKHNDLFEKHVTDRFLKIFEAKLNELGRPLHVQVEYRGKKGQTFKQITLKSSMEDTKLNTKPDQVLSEGEKRAVAFADFMTEVALDPNCTGIILDDPVTSLDLEWREVIAEILIEQVNHRQVIVFTHDSPFLYLIKNVAEQNSLEYAIHWVTRGSSDGKPGYIYLNNAPVLEKDYKNAEKAEDFYKRAKEEQRPDKHEEFLRSGMNALRTSYEALVIFKLFNEVVQRYSDRISVGRLKAIVWNEELVVQIVETFERLSRYIDGHLHPDNSPHAPMTIELLREEIDEFNNLRGKINKKK